MPEQGLPGVTCGGGGEESESRSLDGMAQTPRSSCVVQRVEPFLPLATAQRRPQMRRGRPHNRVENGKIASAALADRFALIGLVAGGTGDSHGLVLQVEDEVGEGVVLRGQGGPITVLDRHGALMDQIADFADVVGID